MVQIFLKLLRYAIASNIFHNIRFLSTRWNKSYNKTILFNQVYDSF